ncbi:hypothetical protein ACJVC5_12605 [Peredibacter sp. HCB2-198]|uniref:hypothetical protein n=1 Tax=Peredibacter sp. HCB2-198 TaxID=3383025 RepID=UPI0038B5CB6D
MLQYLKNLRPHNSSSWNVVLTLAVVIILVQTIAIWRFLSLEVFPKQVIERTIHLVMAIIVLMALFIKKNIWNKRNCVLVYVILFLPYVYFNWSVQIDYLLSGREWIPFVSGKIQILLLAFLVPGPYWVNLVLMLFVCAQNIFIWYHLDLANSPNVVLSSEPQVSFIYISIAIALIAFRYRDQKLIEKLTREKAVYEVHEKLAQIFLSMRDRTNSPLQSQKLAVAILKRECPEKIHLVQPLENSIETIERINRVLGKLETQFPVFSKELMTEEDTMAYLEKIEKSQKLFND